MAKSKLDHIYGESGGGSSQLEQTVTALETKVNNLSNITAKTNLAQSFSGIQTFTNGARNNGTITNNKDVTTKEYVDNQIGSWVTLETWTGNFKTTSLVWTKTTQFSRAARYEFIINIKNGNNNYQFNVLVDILDVTHMYLIGNLEYYPSDVAGIKPLATSGCYFVYDNKAIKIGKYGNNQPEANTQVIIKYRGVR